MHLSTGNWPFSGPTISSVSFPHGWSPCFVSHLSLQQCLHCQNNLHISCLTFLFVLMRGAEKNWRTIKHISSCAFLAHRMPSFLFSNPFCIWNSVLLWSTIKDPFSAPVMRLYFSLSSFLAHTFCPLSSCHFCNKRNFLCYIKARSS